MADRAWCRSLVAARRGNTGRSSVIVTVSWSRSTIVTPRSASGSCSWVYRYHCKLIRLLCICKRSLWCGRTSNALVRTPYAKMVGACRYSASASGRYGTYTKIQRSGHRSESMASQHCVNKLDERDANTTERSTHRHDNTCITCGTDRQRKRSNKSVSCRGISRLLDSAQHSAGPMGRSPEFRMRICRFRPTAQGNSSTTDATSAEKVSAAPAEHTASSHSSRGDCKAMYIWHSICLAVSNTGQRDSRQSP